MKRQLVFVWNYLNWGGAQVYFFAIMKAAVKDWDVLVILPRDSSPVVLKFLDQLNIRYSFVDHQLDTAPADTVARKLQRQFNRIKVEYLTFRELMKFDTRNTVFQIEIAPWQSVAFLTAMSLRGAKVFMAMHNFLPDAPLWRRMVWKSRLQFVSRLPGINIYNSNQDTKDRLRGWVSEKFWEKLKIARTAIDPVQIEAAYGSSIDVKSERNKYGIKPDDFVVLCVGQFIDRKGRWIFLDAARKVSALDNGISFVWLTPHAPSDEDRQRISEYGLGDKFRMVLSEEVGADRLDVLRFFRIADVFTLPSYVEGLPGSMLEAMALGVASISTNVYAIPEALKDNDTGLLIPAGDADALAEAIMTLRNDGELRGRLARRGREFVLENLDERDTADIVIREYTEALERGR